ncbi:MAG: two pore domain potassium channel family protein [Deltaproteobacteria bacterium]|nr:two pore domain potassium channel family protein [Deltaproteobacteria bacterium]MBW2394639.1 two pore domain potassium channel family protein [Deltaproteobacteria bacterium]
MGHATVDGTAVQDTVMGPLGLVFVGALVWALGPKRVPRPLAVLLVAPILVGLLGLDERWAAAAGSWYHIPLLLVATWAVIDRVVHAERVDEDVVVGSICAYVLAAIAFAAIYAGLERALPGAFSLGGEGGETRDFGRLLYFSLVTITTLGYGDITPIHAAAQTLVCVESVLGVLYPAVVVARIVELATQKHDHHFAPAPPASERFGGRYRLLALLLIGTLLFMPWIQASPLGALGLGVLLFVQLLGALYATGSRGIVTWIAWGLAGIALLGGLWQGAQDSPVTRIGLMGQVGFYLVATGALVNWLARERNVTREVLFAALAAYLMLGFSLGASFRLLELLHPGSIFFPDGVSAGNVGHVYFGFMTLTTTGFGEVRPLTPAVESLATMGALVGVFYPAVLLARLVSLRPSAEMNA